MDPESVVGRNIRRIRLSKGVSQETLAFDVGIATRHLGRIEGGKTSATIGMIGRIADALECAIGDLVAESEAPMPPNLPRGKSVRESYGQTLGMHENAVAVDAEPPQATANGRAEPSGTIENILLTGISGSFLAAAERKISEIVAEAGGEKKLSAAQRRRIDLARAWALAKDIDAEKSR